MFYITLIARSRDALPLASYISDDDNIGNELSKLDKQMKALLRNSANRANVGCYRSGDHLFYYKIFGNVAYLTLTDTDSQSNLVFEYLNVIKTRFTNCDFQIDGPLRPYSFLEFDSQIQDIRQDYIKKCGNVSNTKSNLSQVYVELNEVTNITAKNIEDVLRRGEGIHDLDRRAEAISMFSGKFKDLSTDLNRRASCIKIFVLIVVAILFSNKICLCSLMTFRSFTTYRNFHSTKIYYTHNKNNMKFSKVYITSYVRTPIKSFQGGFNTIESTKLGAIVINAALKKIDMNPSVVDEVIMGNVLQASCGQAPARQAALGAGLPSTVPCTTVNKVCASGMKSIMFATQSLMLSHQQCIVAGGMESMSRAPFYLKRSKIPYGGGKIEDSIVKDGLTDAYKLTHMGVCAEKTAKEYSITRQDQDNYAEQSYIRASTASTQGIFQKEIVPVINSFDKSTIYQDDEYTKFNPEKMRNLRPVFDRDNGTITTANASSLNDGAAALVLASENFINSGNLSPIAEIVDFCDAATDPVDFAIAPVFAIEKLLKENNLKKEDITLWEINEAFSVVVLAITKKLNLDLTKVNIHGGAVSLGHPIGISGSRITGHLALQLKKGEFGIAAICNGGGGSSAILLKGVNV
ncbi:hypothetical protein A3Q56_07510 [Intoshia linei]|uniref:Uncharacterized protein n=1 Tax=Intoshia linei TaxID=1819745 RepID=A0A177ATT6_9BILA|nr:hypothetical protein A3Q56_07510 [Intoshia linei]